MSDKLLHVGIVGSRENVNRAFIQHFVTKLAAKYPDATVVSGGAKGADSIAEEWADHLGLRVISFRPVRVMLSKYVIQRWDNETREQHTYSDRVFHTFGQAAFRRNRYIVEHSHRLVAFWDGQSKGTKSSIDIAEELGVPVHRP